MDPRSLAHQLAPPDGRGPLPAQRSTLERDGALDSSGPGALDREGSARFRRIFDEHFAFVWRTLRRLGVGEGSLPDASQRVFWVVARRLDDVDDERAPRFLFGTARRVAADFRRLGRRTVPIDDGETLVDLGAPTMEQLLDQKRARELLDELFDSLDDQSREMLVLQEGEGMSPWLLAVA